MANPSTEKPTQPQIGKFRDLARELECVDDKKAFDERRKRIMVAPPQHPKKEAPK